MLALTSKVLKFKSYIAYYQRTVFLTRFLFYTFFIIIVVSNYINNALNLSNLCRICIKLAMLKSI